MGRARESSAKFTADEISNFLSANYNLRLAIPLDFALTTKREPGEGAFAKTATFLFG